MEVSIRTGEQNFVLCLRETLKQHYGADKVRAIPVAAQPYLTLLQPVAMGGVFVIDKGNAKLHVMVS